MRACGLPGCTAEEKARGLCARHYDKWRRGSLPPIFHPLVKESRDTPGAVFCRCVEPVVQRWHGLASCANCNLGFRP